MIPQFPKQKLLSLDEKDEITSLLQRYNPYSDYNFVSLWSYNTADDLTISTLFGNLVVRFRDYLSETSFYSFLGKSRPEETIEILLKQALKENILSALKLIPEDSIADVQGIAGATIMEDRDNFDYLLSIPELATLEGSKYERQRKEINRFFRSCPKAIISRIDIREKKVQNEIRQLFLYWEKVKQKIDTDSEQIAIERTLRDAAYLEVLSYAIYLDKKMIGFLIVDVENKACAEAHFLKYDPTYSGIKHVLHHALAQDLVSKNFIFLNLEQDFGIPGLRYAKRACKPIGYLKKYIISPN